MPKEVHESNFLKPISFRSLFVDYLTTLRIPAVCWAAAIERAHARSLPLDPSRGLAQLIEDT